jgi:hypothetical protein
LLPPTRTEDTTISTYQAAGDGDAGGSEEGRRAAVGEGADVAELAGAVRGGERRHRRQAERGADLVAGVHDA